jgi:hypothetical protein
VIWLWRRPTQSIALRFRFSRRGCVLEFVASRLHSLNWLKAMTT